MFKQYVLDIIEGDTVQKKLWENWKSSELQNMEISKAVLQAFSILKPFLLVISLYKKKQNYTAHLKV